MLKKEKTMSYSDFWNTNYSRQTIIDSFLSEDQAVPVKKERDLVKLAGYKKAISNFVNIIAGKSVPVTFKGTDSYTDGKKVVLSGNIKESNFDYNCGLAMHEGSHLVYSDFFGHGDIKDIIFKLVGQKLSDDRYFLQTVKELCNYIEDRRIDTLVYYSAPGYKGYYKALYKKYFESKTITKALKTKIYAQETTVSNYMFYICNMTNQWCDSNDLPGLKKIFKMIDLNNVSRLKNTKDCYKLATVVTKEIFTIVEESKKQEEKKNGNQSGKEQNNEGSETNALGNSYDSEEFNPNTDPIKRPMEDGKKYSDRQQKMLENAVDAQRDFLNGKTRKTGLNKNEKTQLSALEKSQTTLEEVNHENRWGNVTKHQVVVFQKITDELVESRIVPFIRKPWYSEDERIQELITDGLRLGTLLGRKLQIRNEEKTLLTTRQMKGKIDKRLIAELGFGNDKVFSQLETSRFKRVNLHLSIDVSGSMHGSKLDNSLKSAIAIAKAATMTNNIDLQISLRGTIGGRGGNKAAVAILYNSKVNTLKHLTKFAKYVKSGGLTPEGLAFEAINKVIMDERAEDNIFVNYSDGMPYTPEYYGSEAVKHTRKAVDNLRYNGYKILSFFLSEVYEDDSTKRDFTTMYGKGASFIEPTNVMMVARDLNNIFLGK